MEVLPEVISGIDYPALMEELVGRSHAARARLAYLVSGVAPELADRLDVAEAGKVWFGPRAKTVRNNARWNIAYTILPVAPVTKLWGRLSTWRSRASSIRSAAHRASRIS